MPFYLAIGVSEDMFWESNPKRLKPYAKAFKIRRQIEDENNWFLGAYIMNAFGVVMSKSFDKHSKAEYLKEPFMKNLTDSEEQKEENSEAEEILASAQFIKYASILKKQGLPETGAKASLRGNTNND